jgi:hypothetical protein
MYITFTASNSNNNNNNSFIIYVPSQQLQAN